MRVTLRVRNAEAVALRLETRHKAIREALKGAVRRSGERVHASAQQLTPVDTGFMRDHLRLSFHREGFSYADGWYAEDFLGTTREHGWGRVPQPRDFYVIPVVFGNHQRAGIDPLTPSLEDDRPLFRRECAEAMRTRA